MTPIEILALIFAVLVLFKLILIIFNPKLRVRIGEAFLNKNPATLTIVFLAVTAISGYYVFSSFSIVDVAAIMMLTSALMGIFFIQYPQIMRQFLKESLSEDFLRKNWLLFLIWAGLAVWALYDIFF